MTASDTIDSRDANEARRGRGLRPVAEPQEPRLLLTASWAYGGPLPSFPPLSSQVTTGVYSPEAHDPRLTSTTPGTPTAAAAIVARPSTVTSPRPAQVGEVVCDEPIDIAVVVDGSESVDPPEFELVKEFLRDFLDRFATGEDRVRMGLVQFSSEGLGRVELSPTGSASSIRSAIDGLTQLEGSTDIEEGLAIADGMLISEDRAGAAQVILLITDGKDNQPGDPIETSTEIRANGTPIVVLGIGPSIDRAELEGIASDPDANNLTIVDSFSDLETAADRIAEQVCQAASSLSVTLAPSSDRGESNSDRITNVSRPVFQGVASPEASVRVSAVRDGDGRSFDLGRATANAQGRWQLTSTTLADGIYTITATTDNAQAVMNTPLVIDTVGPRVVGARLEPQSDNWSVDIQDDRSGLAQGTLTAANASVVSLHTPPGDSIRDVTAADTLDPIAGDEVQTVDFTIDLDSSAPATYALRIRPGGVADRAGNALDGEYRGRYPSGNGEPGGLYGILVATDRQGRARASAPITAEVAAKLARRDPDFLASALVAGW